jgi:uncharacterized protein (TIGR02145 family)
MAAQGGVTVSGLAVNGGTVTFNVSWKNTASHIVWSDTVWVFVDYNAGGVMRRLPLLPGATLTATSAPGTAKVVPEPGNRRGVWVVGNARSAGSFSAAVQLPTATANLHGMCAYASNYPPVGNYTTSRDISFIGTPPYNLVIADAAGTLTIWTAGNTCTVPNGYTVQSFTDKTGAPGIINTCTPSAVYNLKVSEVICCAGDAVTFALSNTAQGQAYQLYKDNVPVMNELAGTGSGATFTGTFAGAGKYAAKAVARNGKCTAAMNGTFTVNVNPPIAKPVIAVSPGTVCQNSAISAWVTAPAAGTTYSWTASPGTASGSSYTFATPAGAKTATVYAHVAANGIVCRSDAATAASATSTLCSIIDPRDGKKYYTVIMPDGRTWFAQNLNYTKDLYANNTSKTAHGAAYTAVSNGVPAIGSYWCPPVNGVTSGTQAACDTYGALYTWETTMMIDGKYEDEAKTGSAWKDAWVSSNYFNPGVAIRNEAKADRNNARGGTSVKGGGRGICPPGWHVPTSFEWATMLDRVDGSTAYTDNSRASVWLGSVAGKILKSAATHTGTDQGKGSWLDHNNRSTDYLGFSAEPAGDRELHGSDFVDRGIAVYFWTSVVCNSSRGWRWRFDYNQAGANINNSERSYGFSVRCIKD